MYRRPLLGRERRGEAAPVEVAHPAQAALELVIGHVRANLPGDLQDQLHLDGAEPVVATGLEEDAPVGAMAEGVFFAADPALPGVAHTGRPLGDDQAAYARSELSQRLL